MGRLVLNVLLSFAQFEREVTGERIRDKIAASKKKGWWMGGVPPLGYDVEDRHLIINEAEAQVVRYLFQRYLTVQSVSVLVKELREEGRRTKVYRSRAGQTSGGRPFSRGHLYHLLHNRIYRGEIVHRKEVYDAIKRENEEAAKLRPEDVSDVVNNNDTDNDADNDEGEKKS